MAEPFDAPEEARNQAYMSFAPRFWTFERHVVKVDR